MPLYEYQCHDCATVFETLRPMSQADAPAPCEQCGSEHTNRMLSRLAAIYSGGSTAAGASHSSSGCGSCSSGSCSHCGR